VRPPRLFRAAAVVAMMGLGGCLQAACSVRKLAVNRLGDALAQSGATYASDDDPQLVREALPFALKLIESLLEESPRHRGLLLAAAGGFTQYTYAFVQEDADESEDRDVRAAAALRDRGRRLYLRARDYGLRGLDVAHEGFSRALRSDRKTALAEASREDVPLLYWTAASWGAAIAMKKDDPELMGDLPIVEALIKQALDLQPDFEHGALQELLIAYEGSRSESMGGSADRARQRFEEAVRMSNGQRVQPFLALAETVSVRAQDRKEFESLLAKALAIDPGARPEWRLANLIGQRRARWLLARADLLFAE
jgi:predicted anti-sigma-YlaC factor YlaD